MRPLHASTTEARVGRKRARDATNACPLLRTGDLLDNDLNGRSRCLRKVTLQRDEATLGDEASGQRADLVGTESASAGQRSVTKVALISSLPIRVSLRSRSTRTA
jgi:hypothetical protein